MNEFINQVILVTGAGRGMGRDIALAFSSLGASVAANDINPISVDETVELIHRKGGKATAYVFDIAKRMPIEALVTQVIDRYGRIDVLVNHASVEPDASLLEMDEWEFHRTLDVNLGGPFFTMQQVGRIMRQQGAGTIVNLAGIDGRKDIHKGHSAYLTSQAGLISLTKAAAQELSAHHIRVNAICDCPQPLGASPNPVWDIPSFQHWQEAHNDLKLGDRADLVRVVLFLCSEAGSALTGQVISSPPGK